MDSNVIIGIAGPLIGTGIIVWIVIRFRKREPLTYAEYFMKDKNRRFLHVMGAKRIMPDEGESFDIFEHYVLDLDEKKFIKGESQNGKDLELESEFIKRSMLTLQQKINTPLEFVLPDKDFNDEEDGLLTIYRFEDTQSDTETYDELKNDNLTFIKQTGTDRDRFTMILCRHGKEVKRYSMGGMSDYFFKTIYLEDRLWICFLYRKQQTIVRGGMAVCILNYETGEMILDEFVVSK